MATTNDSDLKPHVNMEKYLVWAQLTLIVMVGIALVLKALNVC